MAGWSAVAAPSGLLAPVEAQPEASRRLSRSYTLFEAMWRLGVLENCHGAEVHVHVLGADRREGQDEASLRATFEPLRQMLVPAGCVRLHVMLCGPNCEAVGVPLAGAGGASQDLDGALPVLTMEHSMKLYHDQQRAQPSRKPDVAVAFNAGIYGYDSWGQTVRAVTALAAPLVVTSYSFAESESDEEAMEALGLRWLWTPTTNPWRSLVPESRLSAGEVLYENAAYQCVAAAW